MACSTTSKQRRGGGGSRLLTLLWMFPCLLHAYMGVDLGRRRHPFVSSSYRQEYSSPLLLSAVSREDVEQAVQQAEALWEQALAARKEANALSDQAQYQAQIAALEAQRLEEEKEPKKNVNASITLQDLAASDHVAAVHLQAQSILKQALNATRHADDLEEQAEAALERSEELLQQHLIDVPDSPWAEGSAPDDTSEASKESNEQEADMTTATTKSMAVRDSKGDAEDDENQDGGSDEENETSSSPSKESSKSSPPFKDEERTISS